ncbi:MAG: DUF5615 family PIN-like protein [Candidatus Micrarchaeota archaeon]|nr:DUF5615 family PIN-like protein [Candidatus Micrarchaeota archaeon]
MKFLVDANLPPELCNLFDSYGHIAKHVNDTTFSKDPHILRHAIREGYIIVTQDIGFQERIIGQSIGPKGLFIPPKTSGIQIAIIPSYCREDRGRVMAEASKLRAAYRHMHKVHLDDDETHSPGWKHRYWELRGVPLRIGVSDREITANSTVIIRKNAVEKPKLGIWGVDERLEELVRKMSRGFYHLPQGAKGLVMIRGFSRSNGERLAEDQRKRIYEALDGMLKSMVTISFARAQLVDIRVDRDATCYRIHDRATGGGIYLNEIREIHNFEEKLAYLRQATGMSCSSIIEDQERVVNGRKVVNSHRNFLRGPLSYIAKRVDTAAAAGIDVTLEHNVTKAINKKDKQFNRWVRAAAHPERALELERLLQSEHKTRQQQGTNFKQPYIMSNSSKSNNKVKTR